MLPRHVTRVTLLMLIAVLMPAILAAVAHKKASSPAQPALKKGATAASSSSDQKTGASKLAKDDAIVQAMKDISAEDAKRIDEKLVSFGTRHTL